MDDVNHPDESLIQDCKRLLRMPWNVKLSHVRIDGNKCTDLLPNMGHLLVNDNCMNYLLELP